MTGADREHALGLLRTMLLVRRFEERCAELYSAARIRGFLHLYIGEEAVAVGAMQALGPRTRSSRRTVSTDTRSRAACRRTRLMAELFGKVEGCCRGRGGSMHVFDASRRFYGGNAIVGGGLPLAVGLALADRLAGPSTGDRVLLRRGRRSPRASSTSR